MTFFFLICDIFSWIMQLTLILIFMFQNKRLDQKTQHSCEEAIAEYDNHELFHYPIIPQKRNTIFISGLNSSRLCKLCNLSLKYRPDFSFKMLTSASRISCFQLSFDKLKSYHPHQPESHHSSLSNTSDWVNKAWQWLDLESIKVGKIKTVRLVRVTLIAGLLPRLTSVWIISSQIFHFLPVRLTGWSN